MPRTTACMAQSDSVVWVRRWQYMVSPDSPHQRYVRRTMTVLINLAQIAALTCLVVFYHDLKEARVLPPCPDPRLPLSLLTAASLLVRLLVVGCRS